MANYSSASFSATTSSWTEKAPPTTLSSEYFHNNPLKASQIVATASVSSRAINLPLEEMQIKFTLMAAEVDRLLILNSLMGKECEHWRKRFLETERPSYNKEGQTPDKYKQKCSELEIRLEQATRQSQRLDETLAAKEREILGLKKIDFSADKSDKDREIAFWKEKCAMSEAECFRKTQDIKGQTELIVREKIEREVQMALQHHEEEKRTTQLKIDGLIRERDVLLKQPISSITNSQTDLQNRYNKLTAEFEQRGRDIAFWKDKYQNLEAQIEPNIRSTMEARLNETITPILQQRDYLAEQLRISQEKLADNEQRIITLTGEYNRVNDQLRQSDGGIYGLTGAGFNIEKHQGNEREKKAGFPTSSGGQDQQSRVHTEQVRSLEARIDALEGEKRSLRGALAEYETKFESLIRDNTILSDQIRAMVDLDIRFQNLLKANQGLELRNRELQDIIIKHETALRGYEGEISRLNQGAPKTLLLQGDVESLNRRVKEDEVIIKDLRNEIMRTQKISINGGQLQAERDILQRQVREGEIVIQRLSGEAETWKTKYLAIERQQGEIENRIRQDIERNTRSHTEMEMNAQIEAYEKEKIGYESTLDILRQKFTDFEEKMVRVIEENERLKTQINELETEQGFLRANQRYEKDAQDLKKQIILLDEKFRKEKSQDSQRIQMLESQLNNGSGESEQWRQKYHELEQETQAYIEKTLGEVEIHFRERIDDEKNAYCQEILHEKRILEERLQDSERIIEEDSRRFNEMKKKYEQERKSYIEKELHMLQNELNQTISEYERENQRLGEVIQDYQMKQILYFIEIERLFLINGEFIEEINRITEEINYLLIENERLNQELTDIHHNGKGSAQDKAKYEKLIRDLKDQIEEYENRVQLIMDENSRLSDLSLARLKEIDNLKNSLVIRGSTSTENNKKSQVEAIKKSQADFSELNLRHENEKLELEEQIVQLRQNLETNRLEIKKLQGINERRKTENEALYLEIENSRGSSRGNPHIESELKIQREQYQQSLKEVDEMRRARDFYRLQLEQMTARMKENVDYRINEAIGSGMQDDYRSSYVSNDNRGSYK